MITIACHFLQYKQQQQLQMTIICQEYTVVVFVEAAPDKRRWS